VFIDVSTSLVGVFMRVSETAADQDLFKFIINFRILYKFFELPEEFNPPVLFKQVVLNWISAIGERMITWIGNAIRIDTFAIDNQRDRTSSSLRDMMTVFTQSMQFLKALQWEDDSLGSFLESFLSLCTSSIRLYTHDLTLKMLSYFPIKVVEVHEARTQLLTPYMNDLGGMEPSDITPAQIFVIINNFMNIRRLWKGFVDFVQSSFPGFTVGDHFLNPVPHISATSRAIPALFAEWTSQETTAGIAPYLWVKNSKAKRLLIKTASVNILNPDFTQRTSQIFIELYDRTVNIFKTKIDELDESIGPVFYTHMLQGLFHGLDTGLMNLLIQGAESSPIKFRRLVVILEFFQDVLTDVKEHAMSKKDAMFTEQLFVEFTPFTQYMFKHLRDDPMTLANDDPRQANIMVSMCIFLIVSSQFEDNKKAAAWTKETKHHYVNCTFVPTLDPKMT
jgi:hypothetical protein